jgi:hypothetical protein
MPSWTSNTLEGEVGLGVLADVDDLHGRCSTTVRGSPWFTVNICFVTVSCTRTLFLHSNVTVKTVTQIDWRAFLTVIRGSHRENEPTRWKVPTSTRLVNPEDITSRQFPRAKASVSLPSSYCFPSEPNETRSVPSSLVPNGPVSFLDGSGRGGECECPPSWARGPPYACRVELVSLRTIPHKFGKVSRFPLLCQLRRRLKWSIRCVFLDVDSWRRSRCRWTVHLGCKVRMRNRFLVHAARKIGAERGRLTVSSC